MSESVWDRAQAAVRGRTVVVTGASSGVGAEFCRRIAAPDVRIVLIARRAELLEEVAQECRAKGADALTMPVDLRDLPATDARAKALADLQPDVLVCNAGHSIRRPVAEQADRLHDFVRTTGVNYLGEVALVLPLLPGMRERRRGTIIGVTTISAHIPTPGWGAYAASKAAFSTFLRCIGPELEPDGVEACVLELPLIKTPMAEPTYGPEHKSFKSPAWAAAQIAGLIVKPRPLATPWWARVGAVLGAVAPRWMGKQVSRTSLKNHRKD